QVMRLSATSRQTRESADQTEFGLEEEDSQDVLVLQRTRSSKTLTIEPLEPGIKKDAIAVAIARTAAKFEPTKSRVLVYVQSPETAHAVQRALCSTLDPKNKEISGRIATLTGTMRGYERDALVKNAVFQAFRSDPGRSATLPETHYLISTSAGEVGADWDADHLVCDLTTIESMAQRFGRVNRLGGPERKAQIVLIQQPIDSKTPRSSQLTATLQLLQTLPKTGPWLDASPLAISSMLRKPDAKAGFSPPPRILPTSTILFDAWSCTTFGRELPGKPEVAPYLHGETDWEPPETHVAWRADLSILDRAECTADDLEAVFDAFPLLGLEQLRESSFRVVEALGRLIERLDERRHAGEASLEPRAVLFKGGSIEWVNIRELVGTDRNDRVVAARKLAFATLVLPVELGGLHAGFLDGDAGSPSTPALLDVAELTSKHQPARQRIVIDASGTETTLTGHAVTRGLARKLRLRIPYDEEAGTGATSIEYRVVRGECAEPGTRVLLADHNRDVAVAARAFASAIGGDAGWPELFGAAGQLHDCGKDRTIWQSYAGNPNGQPPIAKGERYLGPQALRGYRHEFGSLNTALLTQPATGISDADRTLMLHLIAAHHGWARPHFEPKAADPTQPSDQARDTAIGAALRFASLQQKYGRWGLAWLESILRCADAAASAATQGNEP
ncbi:MAG: type I-U CRISPR-associated helicase/endonuclease Cas3, partial [Planctomycetota bacterium]|nr:type I-U CRISPR-associated helicase/endonuclease Cas3 [Planctomycetota bacterium]